MLSKVLQTRDVSTFLELQFVSAGSSRGLDILGYCTECPTSTGVLYTLLHVVEMLSNGLCPTSTGVHYTILQQTTSRNSCRNSGSCQPDMIRSSRALPRCSEMLRDAQRCSARSCRLGMSRPSWNCIPSLQDLAEHL